jgi:hypothetical protein
MTEPSLLPEILVHEIEEIDLRTVFPREDHAFTPWLSQPENLARLGRALGLDIELKATEVGTGIFRTDILGTNLADGSTIVIENQFGRSDHDHLGKALTYLAANQDTKIVIWLAEAFADEHRAALTWLNDNTLEDIAFYGIAPKLMRIAGSPPGLRFDVIIAPNSFVKSKKQEARKIDEAVGGVREAFWSAFDEALAGERSLADLSAAIWRQARLQVATAPNQLGLAPRGRTLLLAGYQQCFEQGRPRRRHQSLLP